ncbi:MAG: hypothetical protein HN509_15095 [Halobacteriovoraceae bacterium]|jgi:hypothetical protein|nr:hypothetical protein [Halobacteriovoraceae bacterium]MBT5095611.1 hypothetical protein [Halobacteriovoraceae bacterium]
MNKFRDSPQLIQAKKELQEYLSSHPQLWPLQREIEELLEEVGDSPSMRLQVVMRLISESLNNELLPELNSLLEKVKIDKAS